MQLAGLGVPVRRVPDILKEAIEELKRHRGCIELARGSSLLSYMKASTIYYWDVPFEYLHLTFECDLRKKVGEVIDPWWCIQFSIALWCFACFIQPLGKIHVVPYAAVNQGRSGYSTWIALGRWWIPGDVAKEMLPDLESKVSNRIKVDSNRWFFVKTACRPWTSVAMLECWCMISMKIWKVFYFFDMSLYFRYSKCSLFYVKITARHLFKQYRVLLHVHLCFS